MAVGCCLGLCASTICCAGNACEACSRCCGSCGVKSKGIARLAYVIVQFVAVLIAFVMMYTLKPLADSSDFVSCVDASGQGKDWELYTEEEKNQASACFGISAVLRMTFALFVFHFFILILIMPRFECSAVIHDGGWCLKLTLIIVIFICFFFIPIEFFAVWAEISRYAGIIFLLVQVLYILGGAYNLNDALANSETSDDNWKMGTMLCYTILLTSASIGILIGSFIWFLGVTKPAEETPVVKEEPPKDGGAVRLLQDGTTAPADETPVVPAEVVSCGTNLTLIILTIIMVVLNYVLSLLKIRDDSSIMTSSMVNLWLTYLMWSALASQPDENCNSLLNSNWATFIQIFSHLIWTFITLVSLSVANTEDSEKGQNVVSQAVAEEDQEAKVEEIEVEMDMAGSETKKGKEIYVYPVTVSTVFFQVVLMLVTCHYSMIMTNWGDPVVNNDKSEFFAANWSSFGIKIGMQYASWLLYTVTMFLPRCCPDRFQ